jgi:hypothetical protein
MAIVARPTVDVSITLRDNDGAQAGLTIQLPGATTPANAITFATSIIPLILPLTDAIVVGYNVIFGSVENAIPAIPESDVEDKGYFLFNTANGNRSTITIPGFKNSLLLDDNQDINLADTDVAAFVDALTLGLSALQPTNNSGADIVGVREAYKQNRRSHLTGRRRKG